MERTRALIKRHEGKRNVAYLDSRGFWTVGWGHCFSSDEIINTETHPTWSDNEIEILFEHDFKIALSDFHALFPQVRMTSARQAVLVDMLFNLGRPQFIKFRKMIRAILRDDWIEAGREMRNSRWFAQVGHRGEENATMLETGDWQEC